MKQIAKMMEKKLAGWLTCLLCALACGVAEATDYYWKGGASGEWALASNWATDSALTTEASSFPNATDAAVHVTQPSGGVTLTFGTKNGTTVKEDDLKYNIATLKIEVPVTLTNTVRTITYADKGGDSLIINSEEGISGSESGVLTLKNMRLRPTASKAMTVKISTDVYVAPDTVNVFYCQYGSQYCAISGDLTGSGYLGFYQGNGNKNNTGFLFTGNNSQFKGTIETRSNTTRDDTNFSSPSAVSAQARYTLKGDYKYYYDNQMFASGTSSATNVYKFGELNGSIFAGGYAYVKNVAQGLSYAIIEVGALDENDMTISGNMGGQNHNNGCGTTLRKRGSHKLTWTSCGFSSGSTSIGGNLADLEIYGGTVSLNRSSDLDNTLPGSGYYIRFLGERATLQLPKDTDPSAKIRGSTAAITFDDRGTNSTWSTAINNSNTAGLTKVGSGTLTLSAAPEYSGATTVSAGKLVLPKGTTLKGSLVVGTGSKIGLTTDPSTETAETLLTWTTEGSSATLGNFDITPVSPMYLELVADAETGTTSLMLQRTVKTYTWCGVTGGKWSDLSNWKIGTDAATILPDSNDKITIGDDIIVIVEPDQVIGTVTLGTNSKLAVAYTDSSLTFALPSGLTQSQITVAGPYSATYDAATGFTATRVASTFVWASTSGTWSDLANWKVNGLATSALPGADDTASFPSSTTVTLSQDATANSIMLAANAQVEIVGNGHYVKGMTSVGGESIEGDIIVLNDVKLESVGLAANATTDWYADMKVAGSNSITNWIYCNNAEKETSTTAALIFHGNLSGFGNLALAHDGNNEGRGGVSLAGNNASFEGMCEIHSGSMTRGPATFVSADAGSANARWVYVDGISANTSAGAGTIANVTDSTIRFGTYEGNSYILKCQSATGNTIEVGGKGIDFTCSLSARSSTAERANNSVNLRKVGAGTMTFGDALDNPCFNTYEMNDGVLLMANRYIMRSDTGSGSNDFIIPTYTFTGGTIAFAEGYEVDISTNLINSSSPISISIENDVTWYEALDKSNSAGLTKKGAGTLTLSVAPGWTKSDTQPEPITVEQGAVILPTGTSNFTVGSNTRQDTTYTAGIKLVPADEAGLSPYTWLKFNDSTNEGAVVSQTFGNYGTCTVGFAVTDGQIVKVADGNYAWQYGANGYSVTLAPGQSVYPTTYSVRMNLNGGAYGSDIVYGPNGQNYGGTALMVDGNKESGYTISVTYCQKASRSTYITYKVPSDKVTGFHTYTVVSAAGGASRSLYVDGEFVEANSVSRVQATSSQNSNLGFGRQGNFTTGYVPTGLQIDDFRAYSAALSAKQVAQISGNYYECDKTISSDTTWSALWSGSTEVPSGAGECVLTFSNSAKLTIDKDVSLLKFTATGTGTIDIPVGTTLIAYTQSSLASSIKITGGGTLRCVGYKPSTNSSFTDANSWTGTVFVSEYTASTEWTLASWGNAKSTVKLADAQGYLTKNGTFAGALELEDHGDTPALTIVNGFSGGPYYQLGALKGTGTLKVSWTKNQYYHIKDASNFTGSISLVANGCGVSIDDATGTVTAGKITIAAGKEAQIAVGKTWTAPAGIEVNGTLTVAGTASGTLSGSGEVIWENTALNTSNFASNFAGILDLNTNATLTANGGTHTLGYMTGTGDLDVLATTNLTLVCNNFTNYTGSIELENNATTANSVLTLDVSNIWITETIDVNKPVLKCTSHIGTTLAGCSNVIDLVDHRLNGVETNLVVGSDGIYIAVASVTKDGTTTYYPTIASAIVAVGANQLSSIKVLSDAATIPAGYQRSGDTIAVKNLDTTLPVTLTWLPIGSASGCGAYRDPSLGFLTSRNQTAAFVGNDTGDYGLRSDAVNAPAILEVAGYPDVITIIPGADDDLVSGEDVDTNFDEWAEIVTTYATLRPNSKVVVSTLLPVAPTNAKETKIEAFNKLVREASTGKLPPFDKTNVILADIADLAFDDSYSHDYFTDETTPNTLGANRVALALAEQGFIPAINKIAADDFKLAQVCSDSTGAVKVRLSKATSSAANTAATLTITGTTLAGGDVSLESLSGTLGADQKTLTFSNTTTLSNGTYTATLTIGSTEIDSDASTIFEIAGTGAKANVAPVFMESHDKLYQTVTWNGSEMSTSYTSEQTSIEAGTIDRVGYYIELARDGEPAQFVWVAMDAHPFSFKAVNAVVPPSSAINTTAEDVHVYGKRIGFTTDVEDYQANLNFTAAASMVAKLVVDGGTAPLFDLTGLNGTTALHIGALEGITGDPLTNYNFSAYSVKKIEVWVDVVTEAESEAKVVFDSDTTAYYRNVEDAIAAAEGRTVVITHNCTNAPVAGVSYPSAAIEVPSGVTLTFYTSAADQVISVTNLTGSGTVVIASGATLTVGGVELSGAASTFAGSITVESAGTLIADCGTPWGATATVEVKGLLALTCNAYTNDVELTKVTWKNGSTLDLVDDWSSDGTITVRNTYSSGEPTTTNVVDTAYVPCAISSVEEVTDANSVTRNKYTYTPRISGSNCMLDYTFTNKLATVTGSKYVYHSSLSQLKNDYYKLVLDGGTTANYVNQKDGQYTALKLWHRPYRGYTGDNTSGTPLHIVPDDRAVTVATIGTFATTPHTCFVSYGGVKTCLFLATGDTVNEVELVRVNSGANQFTTSACTVLTTMRVPNATTAAHSVVFATKDHQTFDIYLDGTLWCSYTFPQVIQLGCGVQLGGWFGGSNNADNNHTVAAGYGYFSQANTTTAANASVSAIRIYDGYLGPNAVAAIAEEFPYESPSIPYDRLLESVDTAWEQAERWLNKTNNTVKMSTPDYMSRLIITNGMDTVSTLSVNYSQMIESLELAGEGSIVFTGGTGNEVETYGKVTVKTDVTNAFDAIDIVGVPLYIAEGKHLVWDLNAMPIDDYAGSGTTTNRITGVVSGTGDLVLEYPNTKRFDFGSWTNESDHCIYLIVIPPQNAISTTNSVNCGYISARDNTEAVVTNVTDHAVTIPDGVDKLTVQYDGIDITSAFSNCVNGVIGVTPGTTTNLALQAGNTWSWDGTPINVTPTLAEVTADNETVPPMALTGDGKTAEFGVNAIPGLWYAIETSADGTNWTVDDTSKQQATQAGGLKLTSSKQGNGTAASRVTHYRLRVAPSEGEVRANETAD